METLCLLPQPAHLPHQTLDNGYSKVEIGVLQLAADILRVSVDDLARLRDLISHTDFAALGRVQHHAQPAVTAPPAPAFDAAVLAPHSAGALISSVSASTQHDMPPPSSMPVFPMDVEPVVNTSNPIQPPHAAFTWTAPALPDHFSHTASLSNPWPQDYFSGSDTSSDCVSFPNSRRSSVDDDHTVPAPAPIMSQFPIFPSINPDLGGSLQPGMSASESPQLDLQEYSASPPAHHANLSNLQSPTNPCDVSQSDLSRTIQPRTANKFQLSSAPVSAGVMPSYRRFRGKKNASIAASRTRSAFEPEQRQRTALIRKMKACIRCHLQKEGCGLNPENPDGPCPRCMRLQGPNATGLPCLRYKISEAQLLDKGAHPRFSWTRRFTSMSIVGINEDGWRSPDLKTITLTQDVGIDRIATFQFQVREFIPIPGDSIARSWHSKNGLRSHPCTPYAIADVDYAAQTISEFVDQNIGTFIEFYVDGSDELLRHTYLMAYHHSRSAERQEERALLRSVLRLWVASRMESKQERICGGAEYLGMEAQMFDPEATNYGNYLVPPVMQAQIELLTTAAILLPEKENILKSLENFMKPNQPKNWFTIYLALFILLHSCALLTQAEFKRAAREGFIGPNPRYHDSRLVEEIHNGARTLLAYFHFCNKGNQPFKIDWSSPPNMAFAQLDADQVDFMKATVMQVQERNDRFRQIKQENNFEDDYYFISQLYESDWRPVHTV